MAGYMYDPIKCQHIETYKAEHGVDAYEIVHGFFVCCIGKNSRIVKAEDCVCNVCKTRLCRKRIHGCLYCAHFGCFEEHHIHQHALETGHNLAVDINFGYVYCFICGDYRYDFDFEKIANRHRIIAARQRPELSIFKYLPQREDIESFKKFNPSRIVLSQAYLKQFGNIIGLRGIVNMENTCYINCILQSLVHAPVFRDYFLSDEHKCTFKQQTSQIQEKGGCIACEMEQIVQEFYCGKVHSYVPDKLLYLIWIYIKSFAGCAQRDAHEFLLLFLNILQAHCAGTNEQVEQHTNCMMDNIFTGFYKSEVRCMKCNVVSNTSESFKVISLDINYHSVASAKNSVNKKDDPPVPTLIDCLDRYTGKEVLDNFTCDTCKSMSSCNRQIKLKKLPLIVTFHLDRMPNTDIYNNQLVEFPECLNLTPHMSYYEGPSDDTNQKDLTDVEYKYNDKDLSKKFYLFAVVKYAGDTEFGHYTTYIRMQKNKWYICNDEIIMRTKFEDVKKVPAYLLFYHKKYLEYETKQVGQKTN